MVSPGPPERLRRVGFFLGLTEPTSFPVVKVFLTPKGLTGLGFAFMVLVFGDFGPLGRFRHCSGVQW